MIIPVVFLLAGVVLGAAAQFHIPAYLLQYAAVAIVAGLDTIFGGIVAALQNRFQQAVFVSGFFANALLAAGLTLIGTTLGIDLYLAAVIVFGTRIFSNLGNIRHILMEKPVIIGWKKRREEKE